MGTTALHHATASEKTRHAWAARPWTLLSRRGGSARTANWCKLKSMLKKQAGKIHRTSWHWRFATRFARIDSHESFAILIPIFYFYSSENSRRLWLSEIPCWKGFRANFDAAGKLVTDFPTAWSTIPSKVWAFSGKENRCWKIGPAFGNAPGFSPLRPPQPSWVSLNSVSGRFARITRISDLRESRHWATEKSTIFKETFWSKSTRSGKFLPWQIRWCSNSRDGPGVMAPLRYLSRRCGIPTLPLPPPEKVPDVNGGFRAVIRDLPRDQVSVAPFNLNLTSFLPQLYLFKCLPPFDLFQTQLISASSGISNHGLEITVYRF